MKVDYLKKKKQFVPHALLGVAGVLAVLTVFKLWDYYSSTAKAQSIVSKAAEKAEPEQEDVKKSLAGFTEIANAIKKSNLFVPIPEKHHPVSEVLGIMGAEALINDKWYKAGDRIGDARVIVVEPTQVKIEWDGQEKYFAPIASAGGSPGGPSVRRGGPRGGEGESGGPRPEGPVMMGPGPGGGRFGDMSEEQRAEMRARFEGMRARFESMSPEEREAFRNEMRDRFGGRGPGGPGGGERGGFDGGRDGGRGRR